MKRKVGNLPFMMPIEEKARALYMVTGIDVAGFDDELGLLFSFVDYERRLLFANTQSILEEIHQEMKSTSQDYYTCCTPNSHLYHALRIYDDLEQQHRIVIMGPIAMEALSDPKPHIPIPEPPKEQLVYLGRLLYWTYLPDENTTIPQPVVHMVSRQPEKPGAREISLFQLYYKQEPLHITYEEYHELKTKMLSGNLPNVEGYLNDMVARQEGVNRFSLAKGDILRSAKNHFIATCAIICMIAIENGAENEYAREVSYQFVERAENLRTRAEIVLLMKEMILTFTTVIQQFANSDYSALMKEIVRYLHQHFFEKITLKHIADHFGKHPSYISTKINSETGMSFNENLNAIRIAESKRLLTDTQMPIHEIAIAVGFDYQNHFSKVFKKMTGRTPLEYRNQ
ncbi:helix-turn-helix transcriptional regulator [Paenibacillus xanthanilyticus]|uniref:Helix-turn-helix transcriptional regulator n=1 Tax=Paenibacillus xanthanilyticus TaxID=1783531 RepID=A0ABV8K6M9_9BACL